MHIIHAHSHPCPHIQYSPDSISAAHKNFGPHSHWCLPPPEIKDVLTKGKLDADCLYDCLVPNITDSGNELDRGKIGVSSLHIGMGL